ncbi:hypothetical protein [Spiroplasma tabanidicola]|uniref:FAD synthase n=1 Tax=Spiroplasma tabanidicola TaxID=324079 RepID=A0A6I6CCI5_9MOLU|nr:hypothetical protein [Spiroplasma tabanidicola]QGS51842.1 bifunctional riboflavin kinase/FMN adenylyltransferase [Spiroplasma tabanidicola]
MKKIDVYLKKEENFDIQKNNTICIGFFDGIHRAHQKIMQKTQQIAQENNEIFSVMTFNQKVSEFLAGQFHNLQSRKIKYRMLVDLFDPEFLFEIQVNENTIAVSKQDFIDYLKNKLNVKHLVVGSDFTFGHYKEGRVEDLYEAFGKENVFVFSRIEKYSSSNLKQLLAEGKIELLNEKMGYIYKLDLKKIPEKANAFKISKSKATIKDGFYRVIYNDVVCKVQFESNIAYFPDNFVSPSEISIELVQRVN